MPNQPLLGKLLGLLALILMVIVWISSPDATKTLHLVEAGVALCGAGILLY
jgi:hypothetical protein